MGRWSSERRLVQFSDSLTRFENLSRNFSSSSVSAFICWSSKMRLEYYKNKRCVTYKWNHSHGITATTIKIKQEKTWSKLIQNSLLSAFIRSFFFSKFYFPSFLQYFSKKNTESVQKYKEILFYIPVLFEISSLILAFYHFYSLVYICDFQNENWLL